MIKTVNKVDEKLTIWGNWVGGLRVGGGGSLISSYEERGARGYEGDNLVAEQMDRLIAQLPPYLMQGKKAIMKKYVLKRGNVEGSGSLGVSRSFYEKQIERVQIYLDAKLGDKLPENKNLTVAYA